MRYRVLIEQDEDGVYVAEVPALPGCLSQGKTRGEAIDNIKEAVTAYLESLKAHGEPVPPSISEEVIEVSQISVQAATQRAKGHPAPDRRWGRDGERNPAILR